MERDFLRRGIAVALTGTAVVASCWAIEANRKTPEFDDITRQKIIAVALGEVSTTSLDGVECPVGKTEPRAPHLPEITTTQQQDITYYGVTESDFANHIVVCQTDANGIPTLRPLNSAN